MTLPNSLFFLPKYFTQKAIVCFGIILLICFVVFFRQSLGLQWIAFGLVEVIGFFYFSSLFSKQWANITPQHYQKKVFWSALGLRIAWVFFSYFYFLIMTGIPFEYGAADSGGYHGEAYWLAGLLQEGKFNKYIEYIGVNYDDMGYPLYLGVLYYFVGNSIIIARLIKALLGAYTCIYIYKIARNNFGEAVGRVAGILAMLLPNLIYYCGLHVKETEMVFLVVVFAYHADKLLRVSKFSFSSLFMILLLGAALFLFRTVLAVCLIASVGSAAFFVSKRISGLGKRIGLLLLLLLVGALILSTSLGDTIDGYIKASEQNLSSQMDNYSTTTNANKLAKYGSKSIFLPFMFMAPFPTLVDTNQPNPMMLAGAFFTRNVYVFFVFLAFYALYKHKQLRNHILLFSILFSYLFVLASSGFALSERFHLPIVPFLLIFAAYGISQLTLKSKKYYIPYLVLVSVIVVGWNWFKLAGRA